MKFTAAILGALALAGSAQAGLPPYTLVDCTLHKEAQCAIKKDGKIDCGKQDPLHYTDCYKGTQELDLWSCDPWVSDKLLVTCTKERTRECKVDDATGKYIGSASLVDFCETNCPL